MLSGPHEDILQNFAICTDEFEREREREREREQQQTGQQLALLPSLPRSCATNFADSHVVDDN
jgi:hypothetical protein